MAQFDTFLFDTTLFDDKGNPPGSFSVVISSRSDWTAVISTGGAPLESGINPDAR